MRKIISFQHISLDGFVAGPNGEMNWIKANEEIFNYVGRRISQTNAALYGRKTYQMMEGYWPQAGKQPNASKHDIEHSAWYANVRKIVLSKSMAGSILPNTEIISDNIAKHINAVRQEEGSEILLFGSPTVAHELLEQNLVDGFWLFVNPVVLGNGIPLFKNVMDKIKLQLQHTHQFECGVTELSYIKE